MARQKQAVPLQRATSSEVMHLVPEESKSMSTQQNGSAQKPVTQNGSASTKGQAPEAPLETPGLMQLAICVLGIYASL
jgi:UDP-galactose transporter B1